MKPIDIRILGPADGDLLRHVARGVFDGPLDADRTSEFLVDPRHHLAVAVADGVVVGMASAVHYVHPDKPPELWINEVGVAPEHRRAGLGRGLLECLLTRARALGCASAWVLTEPSNDPAAGLYRRVGGTEFDPSPRMFEFDLRESRLDAPAAESI